MINLSVRYINYWFNKFILLPGWWYGVVGHLESCQGNKLYCQCHSSGENIIFQLEQI